MDCGNISWYSYRSVRHNSDSPFSADVREKRLLGALPLVLTLDVVVPDRLQHLLDVFVGDAVEDVALGEVG